LQTKISIKHVDFSLFNNMHLQGFLLEDRKQDTIIYAGDVKVKITDWFFFKKQAELKYIGLENAIIKFQRTDSTWRQQFFLDYFTSPATGTKKKNAGIQFNLKLVELKNVAFIKKDAWLGQDMVITVGDLNLDANNTNLSGNNYEINSLIIKDPVVALNNYSASKPKDTLTLEDVIDELKSAATWNRAQTIIKIADLKIINGTFKSDRQTERKAYSHFDGQHILFTEINGELFNSGFNGDTVYSNLKLTAKERSGLELKNLTADLKMTPVGMTFTNLNLVTNRSTLKNYFSMSYNDMSEMSDFIHKVKMAANFDDSYLDSDDIAFFSPSIKTWKKKISLKGKIRGTVDDLVGKELLVKAGTNTVIDGDLTLTGLPNIDQTFIDLKANEFKTTYSDAVAIVPAIRKVTNPDLRKIQYVNFKGSFTGFIRDFVTFGTIQTNLGTIKSDLNMKLPNRQEPVYSGKIETDNFQLGQFLGDKNIGIVSLSGTVKGVGFNEKKRNVLFDGNIRFADYKNYRYENITVNGRLDKKLFDGNATINDKNLEVILNGVLDFNGKTPRYDLIADVKNINFKNLKLSKDSIVFKGKLNFNFTSNNLDNFLGVARITDAELTKDGNRLPFDSLIVTANNIDNVKTLTAESNEFKAEISGNYILKELPASFTYFLNKYYPSYIKAPARYPANQDLKFNITTYYIEDFLKLVDSSLSGLSNSHFYGDLNIANKQFFINGEIPQFKFRKYNFENLILNADGNNDSLIFTGTIRNIKLNDSLNIPLTNIKITASNDSSKVSIVTGASQTVEKANINALVKTFKDGVEIEIDPSNFTVNGKMWTIDESGVLKFRSNNPASGQLLLTEGEQKILLKTQQSGKGNWSDLNVGLSKINLGDFAPFFMGKSRLEGLVTGNFFIEDPTNNLRITSDTIRTQFLRLDNDSLGEVRATVDYNNTTKELKVKGNTLNQENYLGFDGDIFFGDAEKAKNNLIALKARNFEINILDRFLGTLFTDIQGYLTGDVDLQGAFNNLSVTGKGRLRDAGLRVIFTQCFYKIQDTYIALTPTEINLDGMILKDTVTGNPVYITGGIEHESFKNMFFNLDISTRKPNTIGEINNKPVQLLNTTYKNNTVFYGKVKGTGSLSLAGPQSDMYMDINVSASETDSSSITLPSSSSRESGIADFLVERKYGREMTDSDFVKNATNITYDVKVTANPMVTVKVILDELTGDEIKGKGSGTLNIRSGTSEPLSIRGRFDIDEGYYLFTFQSFFKKPFELRKGGDNYIEWNGDPYDANIKFDAQYKAERVSFAPLGNLLKSSGSTNARGDVYVIAELSNKLFKPDIKFSIDFPPSSIAVTDPELALIIQQMRRNTNEINRQVTYLIVFNSFAPSELAGDAPGSGLGITTISGILLNVLSDQINKILGNLLKSEKYNISLNTAIYNRDVISTKNTTLNLGSNVNFSIGRSFFNNRFIISTGVGFDAALQQTSISQSIQLLPDVTLEWLINQSGTVRASFFYRENTDYITSNVSTGPGKARRYGAALSYRRDFNKLNDLFKRRKKILEALPAEKTIAPAEQIAAPEVKNEKEQMEF